MKTPKLNRGSALMVASAVAGAALVAAPAFAAPRVVAQSAPGNANAAVVVEWNQALLKIVRTAGAQPATIHPTRSFALLHAAIYDAVVSVDGGKPYLTAVDAEGGARPDAAAAQAAHDTLTALYPKSAPDLDALLSTELATMGGGEGTQYGSAVGKAVAAKELAARATDGSQDPGPAPAAGTDPGAYRPAPPAFGAPVFTNWGAVKPFVLRQGAQFRPAAPPALTTATYIKSLDEVRDLGKVDSATRTTAQTDTATFWAVPIWNTWNEVAQREATGHHLGLFTTAQMFAELNVTLADDVIAMYDAKYHYLRWRPITAIRESGDPNWTPLSTTPPDPSYPGAHSAVSAAAAEVLRHYFGPGYDVAVTSEVVPGVTRTFPSFAAVADEAGLSRLYAGVHTRTDLDAGTDLGKRVADYVHEYWTSSKY
ncbi:MAG TPA: vanadium-dependent haloperoxidase [Sporichthyaceae bacterium]|jgi:membrane-associated phospholipid phosphatase